MVYFTCNYCGESLKKAQVDLHLTRGRCSGCSVSCMDCQRDFDAASYSHHIKCISEAEKYSGGNFTPKVSTMNSEKKRNEWMDLVVRVANDKKGRTHSEQKLLDFLATMQSVPTKEKAFMNFIENGAYNLRPAAKSVWALIQKEKELSLKTQQNTNNLPPNDKENSSSKDNDEVAKPPKKSKVVVEEVEEQVVSKKDKKKKSKQNGHQDQNDNVEETATESKKDKKKKKKAKENGENVDNMIEAEQPIVEFESKKEKKKKKKQARENGCEENGDMETEVVSKKKSKKRKLVEGEQPLEYDKKCRLNETLEKEEPVVAKGKFPWREVIVEVLENSKKKSMSMKKLRRKVMSEYQTRGGDPTDKGLSTEKVETKLNKALKKLPNVLIQHETVQLVENEDS